MKNCKQDCPPSAIDRPCSLSRSCLSAGNSTRPVIQQHEAGARSHSPAPDTTPQVVRSQSNQQGPNAPQHEPHSAQSTADSCTTPTAVSASTLDASHLAAGQTMAAAAKALGRDPPPSPAQANASPVWGQAAAPQDQLHQPEPPQHAVGPLTPAASASADSVPAAPLPEPCAVPGQAGLQQQGDSWPLSKALRERFESLEPISRYISHLNPKSLWPFSIPVPGGWAPLTFS